MLYAGGEEDVEGSDSPLNKGQGAFACISFDASDQHFVLDNGCPEKTTLELFEQTAEILKRWFMSGSPKVG